MEEISDTEAWEDSSDMEEYIKDKKPLKYLDSYLKLPSSGPVGAAHIIDTSSFNEDTKKTNLRAADGIATLLFNWKPEALDAFLDKNRLQFEFSRRELPSTPYMTLIIARVGDRVMASLSTPFIGSVLLEWSGRITRRVSNSQSCLSPPRYRESVRYWIVTSYSVAFTTNIATGTHKSIIGSAGRTVHGRPYLAASLAG